MVDFGSLSERSGYVENFTSTLISFVFQGEVALKAALSVVTKQPKKPLHVKLIFSRTEPNIVAGDKLLPGFQPRLSQV